MIFQYVNRYVKNFSQTAGLLSLAFFALGAFSARAQTSDLVSHHAFRVCADPASLPQSNEAGEGFENKIAELMAGALDLPLEYTWFPQATGFVRRTLAANQCDVIIGIGAGNELVQNTNPYYTSTFLFITKPDSALSDVDHLGDEKLKSAKIGLIAGTAPASHMVRYDLMGNVTSYKLFADRRYMNPNQDMLEDLASDKIDAAIIWGPIGGPMVKEEYADWIATPLLKEEGQPFLFARITMGVRRGEDDWKRSINSQIRRHQDEIDAILTSYGVPLLSDDGKALKEVK